jgi:hypothetical protein
MTKDGYGQMGSRGVAGARRGRSVALRGQLATLGNSRPRDEGSSRLSEKVGYVTKAGLVTNKNK